MFPIPGGTYRSNKIPIRELPATGWYRASPRGRTRPRLVFPHGNETMRHRLVFQRGDEESPHLPARGRGVASSSSRKGDASSSNGRGDASSSNGRGDASFSRAGTRRRLVFQRENKALPHLLTVSPSRAGVKRRIVFQRENKVTPRLL
ncbi:hypothetical protein GW17_00026514, partial [Ensete ventricosum]